MLTFTKVRYSVKWDVFGILVLTGLFSKYCKVNSFFKMFTQKFTIRKSHQNILRVQILKDHHSGDGFLVNGFHMYILKLGTYSPMILSHIFLKMLTKKGCSNIFKKEKKRKSEHILRGGIYLVRGTDAAISAQVYSSCPYYLRDGNTVSIGTSGK